MIYLSATDPSGIELTPEYTAVSGRTSGENCLAVSPDTLTLFLLWMISWGLSGGSVSSSWQYTGQWRFIVNIRALGERVLLSFITWWPLPDSLWTHSSWRVHRIPHFSAQVPWGGGVYTFSVIKNKGRIIYSWLKFYWITYSEHHKGSFMKVDKVDLTHKYWN